MIERHRWRWVNAAGRTRLHLWLVPLCALLALPPCALRAQGDGQNLPDAAAEGAAQAVEQPAVNLPGADALAAMLAAPATRRDALLNVVAAAQSLQRARSAAEADQATLARQFLDDRGWLQSLVERYGWSRPHGAVLDPAAWLVLEELGQHGLESHALAFPGAMPVDALLYQVFHRTIPRHAAAGLPVLMLAMEADARGLWQEFLHFASPGGVPDPAWKAVETTWLTPVSAPGFDSGTELEPLGDVRGAMTRLVRESLSAGPPDGGMVTRLRYALLTGADEGIALGRGQAGAALYVVDMVDGLHEGRYLEFVQGLLWLTSNWLESAAGGSDLSLARWLHAELPAISARYAPAFARVDPDLNGAVGAAYRVLGNIVGGTGGAQAQAGANIEVSRTILADAVARLALQIPDMVYYFDTPVRSHIIEQVNSCSGMAAGRDVEGLPTMSRAQFDGCLEGMVRLAEQDIRTAELSGNVQGPFADDTMRRELGVPPWQRINYGVGYLRQRYATDCAAPAAPLPNPLEWAVLATTMTWLVEHAPTYFHTPENEARVSRMRGVGEQLIADLAGQADCLAQAQAQGGDVISRVMRDYETALRDLDLGIGRAEQDFRAQRLRPGADVALAAGAAQRTAYRPDDLLIGPCESGQFCDMSGTLSTTRALIGLFPDAYLLADQSGMGRIEICYRNMEWVERRSVLVRADDENVANYFGRLGFDLMGRYVEGDQVTDIFGFRFTSPDEYHYLFAQASDEILQDSCPQEWVGSRVVTPLRAKRAGIVPNRLTYLAAARNLPSRLLQSNWDRGAEWRDWFVTGLGVTPLDVPPPGEITMRLDQHLQSLFQMEQAEVYQRVFLPNATDAAGVDVSLFDEMSRVSMNKAVMRMLMMLFYPGALTQSDDIRMAVSGDAGLLDGRILRRFREEGVALTTVNGLARGRLDGFRAAWSKQPEALRTQGSIPPSVAYAMTRIHVLYRRIVTARPGPLQAAETQPVD